MDFLNEYIDGFRFPFAKLRVSVTMTLVFPDASVEGSSNRNDCMQLHENIPHHLSC